MALASAAFLSFMLGGWLLGIVLIRDIWKKQYVPATEPGSAPPRPHLAPGPHQTELPESVRRRLGAPEHRGEPYQVPRPLG